MPGDRRPVPPSGPEQRRGAPGQRAGPLDSAQAASAPADLPLCRAVVQNRRAPRRAGPGLAASRPVPARTTIPPLRQRLRGRRRRPGRVLPRPRLPLWLLPRSEVSQQVCSPGPKGSQWQAASVGRPVSALEASPGRHHPSRATPWSGPPCSPHLLGQRAGAPHHGAGNAPAASGTANPDFGSSAAGGRAAGNGAGQSLSPHLRFSRGLGSRVKRSHEQRLRRGVQPCCWRRPFPVAPPGKRLPLPER